MMKLVIAGSRDVSESRVRFAIESCPWIGFASSILSGTARGADRFGERWATEHGIPINCYPARWKEFGRRAGPLRNEEMAKAGDSLIAIWDGHSRGTGSMIALAKQYGLKVLIYRTDTRTLDEIQPTGVVADYWDRIVERAAVIEYSGGMSRNEAERAAGELSSRSSN